MKKNTRQHAGSRRGISAYEAMTRRLSAKKKALKRIEDSIYWTDLELRNKTRELESTELEQWNAAGILISLTMSGNPGNLTATVQLTTPTQTLSKTQPISILNMCHYLKHMSPDTQKVWREILNTANDILSKQ